VTAERDLTFPPNIGHNDPPAEYEILRDQISEKIKSLSSDIRRLMEVMLETGMIDETLLEGADLKRRMEALRKAADEARKDEKRPHDEAIKEIQAFWTPLIAVADTDSGRLGKLMQKELLRRKAAKDAEEQRLRAEAERLREEAARGFERAGEATDLSPAEREELRARAEAAYRASKAVAETAERVAGETAGVKVEDAPAVHVRTARRVRLRFPSGGTRDERASALFDFFEYVMKSPFAADLVEAMTKIANRIYREQRMVPPYCVEYDEHKVV